MTKDGKEIELTAREFEILQYMAQNIGRVISRERLYETVWGEDGFGCDNTIMVHIRHLREKLEDDPAAPKYIVTMKGLGYKLVNPMKNKLKHKPYLHTAAILVALFVTLIVTAICMFYYVFAIPEPEGLSLASWPNTFTSNFSTWIEEKDGTIGVEEIGIERLNEYGLWVQIIDETGQKVFAHNKPGHYPESYSMAELVVLSESKYENGNTAFVSSVTLSDRTLNYVVGFPYAVGKYMLYYNGENLARLSPFTKNVVFCSACIVVLIAFIYAFWLSRRLSTISLPNK